MRALVVKSLPDKRREKVVATDWKVPAHPIGNEVLCQAIFTGLTNGTERNQLIGGNYSTSDAAYQPVTGTRTSVESLKQAQT